MNKLDRVSRRTFVSASSILAAALAGCGTRLIDQTRIAEELIVDPDWKSYQPVLRGLIRVILPLDHPEFPKLGIDAIEKRLISMFPLEKEQRFLGLQRMLALFDHVDLFPILSGPLLFEEEKVRDLSGDTSALARTLTAADGRAFEAFAHAHAIRGRARFSDLSADAQRAYFDLWRDSASVVKRAFHSGMKSLVMITVYSADAMWPAIGYAGPLLPRSRKERG